MISRNSSPEGFVRNVGVARARRRASPYLRRRREAGHYVLGKDENGYMCGRLFESPVNEIVD